MKKFLAWFVGVVVLLVGAYYASNASAHKQRARRLTDQQIKKELSNKSNSLKKAKQLEIKATVAMNKSKAAFKKSQQRQQTLENRNESTMADRIKSFNSSL